MEIKIEKTVNIEVDNTLGYPLVFVGSEYCSREYLQELKLKFFNFTLGLLNKKVGGTVLCNVNSERGTMALKECAVIAKWLDMGYICYPASNLIWMDNLRCGPEYITTILSTILDTDPNTGNRIHDLFLSIKGTVAALLGGGKEASKTGETAKSEPAPTKKPRKYEYFEICNFVKDCAFREIGGVIYGMHFHDNGSLLVDWPMRSGRILMTPPIDDPETLEQYKKIIADGLDCVDRPNFLRMWKLYHPEDGTIEYTAKSRLGDHPWPASFFLNSMMYPVPIQPTFLGPELCCGDLGQQLYTEPHADRLTLFLRIKLEPDIRADSLIDARPIGFADQRVPQSQRGPVVPQFIQRLHHFQSGYHQGVEDGAIRGRWGVKHKECIRPVAAQEPAWLAYPVAKVGKRDVEGFRVHIMGGELQNVAGILSLFEQHIYGIQFQAPGSDTLKLGRNRQIKPLQGTVQASV